MDTLEHISIHLQEKHIMTDNRKKALIVGASFIGDEKRIIKDIIDSTSRDDILILAADGGIEIFMQLNVEPDEWLGDMDSVEDSKIEIVKQHFPDIKINQCSPIKDDTDMAIAVNNSILNGCNEIHIFGGLGGKRIEHSLANIQLVHHCKTNGINLIMYSESSILYALMNEKKIYDEDHKGFLSCFALNDSCEVDISGLFYEYKGELKNSYALGVSNEFIGKKSYINVEKGVVLIIETRK